MIRQIAVIGSGTMGRGIAYLSAVAGYETIVYDVDQSALDAAQASIESTLRKGVEKGKVTDSAASEAMSHLHLANELEASVHGADLIIEAVPENFDLKKDLFAQAGIDPQTFSLTLSYGVEGDNERVVTVRVARGFLKEA